MLDISQIMEMIKTPLTERDLIRVCDLSDSQINQYQIQYGTPDREGMQRVADAVDRDICNLYIVEKCMHHLVYWDGPVFVEIMAYDDFFIKQFKVKEMIDQQYKSVEEYTKYDSSKLGALMYLCSGNAKYLVFKYIYEKIADQEKYELFKNLYVSSEYGFQMFTNEFIEDVMKHKKPVLLREMIKNFPNAYNGSVMVYRGMGSKSTPADKAWSWTTNLNTAIFFATRYSLTGKIVKGKVLIEDIIDYIDDRNESEVFINPKDVKNVEELKLLDFENIQDELLDAGILDQYNEYKLYIDSDSYDDPKGIHGVLHAKRVLLLALIIAYYENLSDEDIEILKWAAIIHDIGRTHDCEEEEHGADGWEKAYESGMLPEFDEEDLKLLQFIVTLHSQDDSEAKHSVVQKFGITNDIRAFRLLKIFKDADGLDRVRIKDLNVNYLRTATAKKMILLANQFLRGIK